MTFIFYLLNAFSGANKTPPRPVFISDEAADLFISFYISDL